MTTQYEQTVAALAEAAGLDMEIGRDRVAEMVVKTADKSADKYEISGEGVARRPDGLRSMTD